jgi:hypothetical protein
MTSRARIFHPGRTGTTGTTGTITRNQTKLGAGIVRQA